MYTTTTEIAPDTFRFSALIPDVAPGGFAFDQFLVRDRPFLFHTGMRGLYPVVSEAIGRVIDLADLAWISFGHVEADECGSMNQFLADAPRATVVHGPLACNVSLNDLADRPPRAITEDEVLDLGHHRLRYIPTPHVPHGWESGVWFDETARTLFCGDLFTQIGDLPAITEDDIVEPALLADAVFGATSLGAQLCPTLERLAALAPTALATMHGSSFRGDCATQLRALAAGYAARMAEAAEPVGA